jgi:hypothetical protein
MAQNKLPTWASILIAAVIVVCVLAATAVGGAAYFIYRHVNTSFTPTETAEAEFLDARQRFAGQQPLIHVEHHNEPPVVNMDVLKHQNASAGKLESLRVLAYDTRAGKLVRITIPFWLLRLAPSRHFSVLDDNGIDFDSDRVHLTIADLERHGPGLILDQTDRRGSKVLVWTE